MEQLGVVWESTGSALDVDGARNKKAVLCLRRSTEEGSARSLVDVNVVHSRNDDCPSERTRLDLPSQNIALCLLWERNVKSSAQVIDMSLASRSRRLPTGQFTAVSNANINRAGSRKIYLYAQMAWQPLELIEEAVDQNGIVGKPPLVATIQSSSMTTGLSFKILQLTNLHYSGDPTTSCHDVPLEMKSSDCSEALMTKFVSDLLDVEKPDFVAFTGDNVQVYRSNLRQRAIDAATAEVVKRGIPFAVPSYAGVQSHSQNDRSIVSASSRTSMGMLLQPGISLL